MRDCTKFIETIENKGSEGIKLNYYTEKWNNYKFEELAQIIESDTHFMGVFPTYECEDGMNDVSYMIHFNE